MPPELTHPEACRLVEEALDRLCKTLLYVRLKLQEESTKPFAQKGLMRDCGATSNQSVKNLLTSTNLLCNINYYGAYLKGAIRMALALRELGLLDIPVAKNDRHFSKPANKALLDLFLSNTRNLDWLLHGIPDDVRVTFDDKINEKGKVVGKIAKFVKKEVKYCEI